jgi:hypothetical protein
MKYFAIYIIVFIIFNISLKAQKIHHINGTVFKGELDSVISENNIKIYRIMESNNFFTFKVHKKKKKYKE